MARGINKAILVGTLGQDPEVRYLPSGDAVTNISIATNESWKDKQTGQQQERVEWHKVVFFNRLAEIAGEYLKKGSQVYVDGKLQTRKWQAQDGTDRYSTEIVANEMQMLGGKQGDAQEQRSNNQGYTSTERQYGTSNAAPAQQPEQESQDDSMDDIDDLIPFS